MKKKVKYKLKCSTILNPQLILPVLSVPTTSTCQRPRVETQLEVLSDRKLKVSFDGP